MLSGLGTPFSVGIPTKPPLCRSLILVARPAIPFLRRWCAPATSWPARTADANRSKSSFRRRRRRALRKPSSPAPAVRPPARAISATTRNANALGPADRSGARRRTHRGAWQPVGTGLAGAAPTLRRHPSARASSAPRPFRGPAFLALARVARAGGRAATTTAFLQPPLTHGRCS